ncbi:hypothetical protein FSP39_011591 [Pinctada imbricata]|uniref:Uncharacterized protein n=1 Tax=Pinctada imbricata TaxID=66713 RepID=A0AA88YMD7_PINIB|nr:hypothetical protein FSP39_011591 [Pinctada imbricata]
MGLLLKKRKKQNFPIYREQIIPKCRSRTERDPTPSGANYFPRIGFTKPSLPQYSIAGKRKTRSGNDNPGPADYSTSGDLTWNNKVFKLKGRPTSHFDEQAKRYCTVNGPSYNVRYGQVGRHGQKFSIAQKQHSNVYTGPPDHSTQPCDSHGFDTPGPNYRPGSSQVDRGPKYSFGIARTQSSSANPGPADYDLNTSRRGPSYSFGTKLPPPPAVQRTVNKDSPSPNTYNIGTTIGRTTSVVIGERAPEPKPKLDSPSPAAYFTRDIMKNKRATTLAYRWFDTDEPAHPGPADYTITKANLTRTPMFSNRQKTNPSYPDSLNYTPRDVDERPGPGEYDVTKTFDNNDAPAYKIAQKLNNRTSDNPAPNAYEYEKRSQKDAPAFSMGKRFEIPDSRVSPGPASYTPQKQDSNNPKYSMTSRPTQETKRGNPAPNAYNLQNAGKCKQNNTGISLKSRASPYVYSGFHTNKISDEIAPLYVASNI